MNATITASSDIYGGGNTYHTFETEMDALQFVAEHPFNVAKVLIPEDWHRLTAAVETSQDELEAFLTAFEAQELEG